MLSDRAACQLEDASRCFILRMLLRGERLADGFCEMEGVAPDFSENEEAAHTAARRQKGRRSRRCKGKAAILHIAATCI